MSTRRHESGPPRQEQRSESDFSEEIQAHIAMETDRLVGEGMNPVEARAAARRKFGNVTRTEEQFYETQRIMWLEDAWKDARYAVRSLARRPGFTVVVVLVLALAIGANTVVFSALNAVLFEPLPYPDADRIVAMFMRFTNIGAEGNRNYTSAPEFEDLTRLEQSFSHVSAYHTGSVNMRAGDIPERFVGVTATPGYFGVLGATPQIGRTFLPEEGEPGRDNVVVLSHALWQSRFGADPDVLTRQLNINDRSYTVIGVMPADFADPAGGELWVPLAFTAGQLTPNSRGDHFLRVLARIRPDLSFAQAQADMARVSAQIIEGAPDYNYEAAEFAVMMFPLLEETVGDVRPALWLMMAAVLLVLLIACANVANLMMVRASERHKELGVRAALGASRTRLARQLLTESTVLSVSGAIAGLAVAWLGVNALAHLGAETIPRMSDAGLDLTTLGFTSLVAIVTGLVFGVVPALQVSQIRTRESLEDSGRSNTAGGRSQQLRRVLVVGEVALSLALLSSAGLLIKSFLRLQQVDPGFTIENVLTLRTTLPEQRYQDDSEIIAFYRGLLERIRNTPGVESAGAINALPLSGNGGSGTTTMDTTALPPEDAAVEAERRFVTPGYFESMGTRLIRGRFFNEFDNEDSQLVAIVDETLANTYWPNEDPIGKRLQFGRHNPAQPWRTVVGVVQYTRYRSLEQASRVEVYLPHAQYPVTGMTFALKTAADPAALIPAIRREVAGLDPEQPVFAIKPMAELVAGAVARRELIMLILAAFAGVALALAALGIYGLMSYWVTQRSFEIGIRLALGASRGNVLAMVTGQSAFVVTIGVAVGLAASMALTRLLESMLFQVDATDLPTFSLVAGALVAVGLLAGLFPAVRASRVDPMTTLRQGG